MLKALIGISSISLFSITLVSVGGVHIHINASSSQHEIVSDATRREPIATCHEELLSQKHNSNGSVTLTMSYDCN